MYQNQAGKARSPLHENVWRTIAIDLASEVLDLPLKCTDLQIFPTIDSLSSSRLTPRALEQYRFICARRYLSYFYCFFCLWLCELD